MTEPNPQTTRYRVGYRIADGQLETSGETPEFETEAEAEAAVTALCKVNGTLDIRIWDIRIDVGVIKPVRVWEPGFVRGAGDGLDLLAEVDRLALLVSTPRPEPDRVSTPQPEPAAWDDDDIDDKVPAVAAAIKNAWREGYTWERTACDAIDAFRAGGAAAEEAPPEPARPLFARLLNRIGGHPAGTVFRIDWDEQACAWAVVGESGKFRLRSDEWEIADEPPAAAPPEPARPEQPEWIELTMDAAMSAVNLPRGSILEPDYWKEGLPVVIVEASGRHRPLAPDEWVPASPPSPDTGHGWYSDAEFLEDVLGPATVAAPVDEPAPAPHPEDEKLTAWQQGYDYGVQRARAERAAAPAPSPDPAKRPVDVGYGQIAYEAGFAANGWDRSSRKAWTELPEPVKDAYTAAALEVIAAFRADTAAAGSPEPPAPKESL